MSTEYSHSPEPNYPLRRLVVAGGLAGAALLGSNLLGAAELLKTSELSSMTLVVDNKDSDGNIIPHSGPAAIEDACNAAFEQADRLKITDENDRERIADGCRTAAQHAIEGEADRSLVGNTITVSIETDGAGNPSVAVVRQS